MLAGYFLAAIVSLNLSNKKRRDLLFCSINVIAVGIPVIRFGFPSWMVLPLLLFYFAIIAVQFQIMQTTSRRSSKGAWFAILFPILVLGVLRCLPSQMKPGLPASPTQIMLTMGLSYLVFRLSRASLEYSSDGTMMTSFPEFVGFAFFFPTMLLGPISSFRSYLDSYRNAKPFKLGILLPVERIIKGGVKYLLLSSLCYRLSYQCIFINEANHPPIDLVVASVAYYLYIYLNFSGFCDLAIGLAALLGIRVEENFRDPLLARNVADFWGRWHITLSVFLRDMMFNPFSKWLVTGFGIKRSGLAIAIATLGVFLVIGVWHGSGLNYLLFGLFHAFGVLGYYFYAWWLKANLPKDQLRAYRENRLVHCAAIAVTFTFVTVSFFLFANNMTRMREILSLISFR
jgi:membrane protein involved in D-alanine export